MQARRDEIRRDDREGAIAAFADVVQSSQEVVLRRLDVLRLEAERRLELIRDETVALAVAGLLAVSAWVLLLSGAVVFLSRELGLGWALIAIGVVNLAIAGLVKAGAHRRGARRAES